MKKTFVVSLCVVFALGLLFAGAYAKNAPSKLSQYNIVEEPQRAMTPPEFGGSMFQAAAANTVVLGWWQFDNANGSPNKQGWTEVDLTVQEKKYWHVAGTPCADAITPIAGTKSMWCGQWPSLAAPWCGWISLPGYGNNWDQSLESTVNVNTLSYAIAWDSEQGYDYTYVEWWDGIQWVSDPTVNGGAGGYDYLGSTTENLTSPYAGAGKVRFHFVSDGAWSDQDGLNPTTEGSVKVDNVAINGGVAETFEAAACNAQNVGSWTATVPPGFGEFGELVLGTGVVQEDPCLRVLSNMWGWFDNPATTNYGCGGWPLQGAIRYGPDANGLYMLNEIWSPVVPISGAGEEYLMQFLSYRDLQLNALIFYVWGVRTQIGPTGCPTAWQDLNFVYYGGQKDWIRQSLSVGAFVGGSDTHMQVSVGAYDYCGPWGGIYGDCSCHAHAPLIDQVKVLRVETFGPQYTWRDIDMWHDNFPELGGIDATSYARCDMAQDILASTKKGILPGDSLKIVVTAGSGLPFDNTGGRTDARAVYVFVSAQDRFGNLRPYTAAAMQSPDNQAWAADPQAGLIRWPNVPAVETALSLPAGWYAYRMDVARTSTGGLVKDTFCADLMDLSAGPNGPPYHQNENYAANTGIFRPGDVIRYFVGAKDNNGNWSYLTRGYFGQGSGPFRTNNLQDCLASSMEWSVLPDAGRLPGDAGDILYVDDADDRGGPAQRYFDWAFKYYGLTDRVDRFDVLGPSSVVGNSLAGRVKNIQLQIIGDPVEIYQKVLWNSTDLSRGLMGDGGTPNGGSSAEKSDDFALCNTFLTQHPDNPGWAVWGDDFVQDWGSLVGISALTVKGTYMNHTLGSGDQRLLTGVTSPRVFPTSPANPAPYLNPVETFYANGGCAVINDFDVPGQSGLSRIAHRYNNATTGPAASLSQVTPNPQLTDARFFLAGFAYNFISDDDTLNPPDYVPHLKEILTFFENEIGAPIGIDPVAFENRLDNNYPNPFNPTTTIKYSVAERGHVSLKVYNAAGQLVRTLVDEEKAPVQGGFSTNWNGLSDNGQPVASGVYFYQLTAQNFSQTKKMVLLK